MSAQRIFLNSVLLPLLEWAQAHYAKVCFADGVHLIYGDSSGHCWCKERVCVPAAHGRQRVNCLGFLDAITFETEAVINDTYLNADNVCEGLDLLRKHNGDRIIYVILDNAAYQKCKKVKAAAEKNNINLIYLPPYSPNLNLIERLWKFLRKEIMLNKYYMTFSDFFKSVEQFFANINTRFLSKLSSLLTFNFECLDSSFYVDLK